MPDAEVDDTVATEEGYINQHLGDLYQGLTGRDESSPDPLEDVDTFLEGGNMNRQLREAHPDYGTMDYLRDIFSAESLAETANYGVEEVKTPLRLADKGLKKTRDGIQYRMEEGIPEPVIELARRYGFQKTADKLDGLSLSEDVSQFHANSFMASVSLMGAGMAGAAVGEDLSNASDIISYISTTAQVVFGMGIYTYLRRYNDKDVYEKDGELQHHKLGKDIVASTLSLGTAETAYIVSKTALTASFIENGVWMPFMEPIDVSAKYTSLGADIATKPIYPTISVILGKMTGYLDRDILKPEAEPDPLLVGGDYPLPLKEASEDRTKMEQLRDDLSWEKMKHSVYSASHSAVNFPEKALGPAYVGMARLLEQGDEWKDGRSWTEIVENNLNENFVDPVYRGLWKLRSWAARD